MTIRIEESDKKRGSDAVAYLAFVDGSESRSMAAALFLVNEIGEPLHFVYDQARIPSAFLWRPEDLRRHTVRHLTKSVLGACPMVPRLLLCMHSQTYPELFTEEIRLEVPVCRITDSADVQKSSREAETHINGGRPLRMLWFPAAPDDESREAQLLESLRSRVGAIEPFGRARAGLTEKLGSGRSNRPRAG